MNLTKLILISTLAILPHAAWSQAAAQANLTRIGAAGAVRGEVKAVAPHAAAGRVIESGKTLYQNDHVTTGSAGHLQVLLLDETVFTIGPSADMVMDDFVYDPNTNAGKVAANVVKGAFRFVTGKVARTQPQNMRVGLAVGSIGVRGTVVMGETSSEGSIVINAGAGFKNNADEVASVVLVTNAGVTREIRHTGQGVTIKPGQPPSLPKNMPKELSRIFKILNPLPKKQPAANDPAKVQPDDDSGQFKADLLEFAGIVGNPYNGNPPGVLGPGEAFNSPDSGTGQVENYVLVDNSDSSGGTPTQADWSDVQAIPSGSGTYSGHGTSTCTGGSCISAHPTVTFAIDVNFSAQTLGGGASAITINNVESSITPTKGFIGSTSYSAFSGPASYSPTFGSITGASGFATFAGTTINLLNNGNTPAKDIQINLQFQDTPSGITSTNGTITGHR